MKLKTTLSPLVLATSVALTGMAVPMASQAETSATFAASNMYLWRGQNLSPDGAVVSGSLDYANGGFYVGGWASSENGGHEMDVYLGYGGEVSDFNYDISYVKYLYPEEGTDVDLSDSDAADVILSLGYGDFGLSLYKQIDGDFESDLYIAASYTYGPLTFTYGTWDLEEDSDDDTTPFGADYSHIQIDYAATDSLTFSVSKASADDDDAGDPVVEEDPLFQVTYSLGFDL